MIRKKLLKIIKDYQLTQSGLARKIGISPQSLNGYLMRGIQPAGKNLAKITKYFNKVGV